MNIEHACNMYEFMINSKQTTNPLGISLKDLKNFLKT